MDKLFKGAQKLGVHLLPEQLEKFEAYYRELIDWNNRINLTSITDYTEVQTKHFLDSLSVVTAINPELFKQPMRVIDIGTGAGMPGIPLKIIMPDIQMVLLEATIKKTKFLQHIIDTLDLQDIEISAERAEDAARKDVYREKFDVALSRAVAPLASLVELALPFCTIGGCLIAQKKGEINQEITQAEKAISVLGGELSEIRHVDSEDLPDKRKLVIIRKIKPTPPNYPRRSGVPVKNPIINRNT